MSKNPHVKNQAAQSDTKLTGIKGLGGKDKKDWQKVTKKQAKLSPIERLADKKLHAKVLTYVTDRFKMSENEMSKFYDRWRVNEKKLQAYIDLPDWENVLKQLNDTGAPPLAVNITVPYIYATSAAIVTYLLHTFTGRKPIFTVGTHGDDVEGARMMETVLQYNCDHTRIIKHFYQFFTDIQTYGMGAMRCQWKEEKAKRTVWITEPELNMGLATGANKRKRTRKEKVVYEGNEVAAIDPFMFFPDPRVPMNEVNTRGEFVFWKSYEGMHVLKKLERAGVFKYVNRISASSPENSFGSFAAEGESDRSIRTGGTSHPGRDTEQESSATAVKPVEFIQGSLEIIPAELGLGEEEYPVKYIFAMGNRQQIIQAAPLDADHDKHPVIVAEPYGVGYGFGQLGLVDYQGPIQDLLSWFLNSHMDNVKTALNNMSLVDPSKIEIQDLKNPGAGKIIRLKPSAYGQDVRSAYMQLPVVDVTSNHVKDFESLMRVGDALSSVTDNIRGLQSGGGRKTATEVRTSGEAAASRLAAQARVISAQALVDLAEQMSLNIQQNLNQEFYLQIVGTSKANEPMLITPEMLVGDFHYPINDGTLPIDKVAMVDVWKEIFLGIQSSPLLMQQYDIGKIFEYVAELGGARNIEQFKIQVSPGSPEELAQQVQAGNSVPVPAGRTGNVNATGGDAANRTRQGVQP